MPGVVVIFSAGSPMVVPLALAAGTLHLGRDTLTSRGIDDPCLSRRHAEVSFDGRGWTVRDLESRNGSALDGLPFRAAIERPAPRVLRVGDTLLLLVADVRPFADEPPFASEEAVTIGPTLARVYRQIQRAAQAGESLHITGETGAGKELAARRFHAEGDRRQGPFVPVNCAAIPASLAERLLFGARKGAYSGAEADAPGYVQSADGGTLFLDEVAELELAVQAKLLRVLESREVLALGASQARRVDVRICSATHRDLRARVAEGLFREDLYFRIGRPHVAIPPLRERPEDVPALVSAALAASKARLPPHVSLLEACLLRPWPGNVRELFAEIAGAVGQAVAEGARAIEAKHLGAAAGHPFAARSQPSPTGARRPAPPRPTPEAIEAALHEHGGNVSRAARALGVHRTQLRRWMERDGSAPRKT